MAWGKLITKALSKDLLKRAGTYAAKKAGGQILDNHLANLKEKNKKRYGYGESGSARYARKPMDIENV